MFPSLFSNHTTTAAPTSLFAVYNIYYDYNHFAFPSVSAGVIFVYTAITLSEWLALEWSHLSECFSVCRFYCLKSHVLVDNKIATEFNVDHVEIRKKMGNKKFWKELICLRSLHYSNQNCPSGSLNFIIFLYFNHLWRKLNSL
jgi:hypothetical protein